MELISYCARASWAESMANLLSPGKKCSLSFHPNSDDNRWRWLWFMQIIIMAKSVTVITLWWHVTHIVNYSVISLATRFFTLNVKQVSKKNHMMHLMHDITLYFYSNILLWRGSGRYEYCILICQFSLNQYNNCWGWVIDFLSHSLYRNNPSAVYLKNKQICGILPETLKSRWWSDVHF